MARDRSSGGARRGGLRETLGALTCAGIRALSAVARRLGSPALATVPVSAVMLSRLQTVGAEQPLEDAAQLLVAGRRTEVPVVAHGETIGVVTRDDLAVAVQVLGPRAPVAEAHHHGVVTVAPGDPIADVLRRLRDSPETVAIVVDRGEPVGVLTFEHLRAYLDQLGRAA